MQECSGNLKLHLAGVTHSAQRHSGVATTCIRWYSAGDARLLTLQYRVEIQRARTNSAARCTIPNQKTSRSYEQNLIWQSPEEGLDEVGLCRTSSLSFGLENRTLSTSLNGLGQND